MACGCLHPVTRWAHTSLSSSPTFLSPCARLDSDPPLGHRNEGRRDLSPLSPLFALMGALSHQLSRWARGGPGSLWQPLKVDWDHAPTLSASAVASVSHFRWGTNTKELALPTPTLPAPPCPPRFWFHLSSVHKLPLDSCVVFLFNVSFWDIRHRCCCSQRQMFILIAPPSAHIPLLRDARSSRGTGLRCSRLGN